MKIYRYVLFGLSAGLSAFAVSSCAYDPYYSTSYGGYGDGYGYGNSSFSSSFFVSTGDSRWAYDPYAACYFDYTRRAYYDPYLSGYYPVGYRPRYVVGAPHPGGWRRGSDYCPPPRSVRSYNLTNYHDRTSRYRSLGRDWSRNVRTSSQPDQHPQFDRRDQRPAPFSGLQGGSSELFDGNSGRGWRNGDRDGGREGRSGFRGQDEGGRQFSREGGGEQGNIPQPMPQPPVGFTPPPSQGIPVIDSPIENSGGEGGENRGGGERLNFENSGGEGEILGDDSGQRGGDGERIQGIGES